MDAFQAGPEGGFRVSLPTPEYLFAMKCMAMRAEGIDGSRDISDIEGLARICRIHTAAEALDLVDSFYPARIITPKVRFGLEEIMERLETRSKAALPAPMIGGSLLLSGNPQAATADGLPDPITVANTARRKPQ